LRQSIETSLRLLQRDRLDIFFLHSNLVPDGHPMWNARMSAADPPILVPDPRPADLREAEGRGVIGAWG